MRKRFGKKTRAAPWCVLLLCFLLCGTESWAAEAPSVLLKNAWAEYGFQAFDSAQNLFEEAEESPQSTPEQRLQARLGLAFITHQQMPGRDPEAALTLYESLLQEIPQDHNLRFLLLSRIGDCHAESDPPEFERARQFYRQGLETATDTSLMVQETILRLVTTYMNRPDSEAFAQGLAVAEEFAPRMQGVHFESIFYGLQVELSFFLGAHERMAAALERQYRAGISNVKVKENVLFQLARLHEVELRDFPKAEAYYRQLAAEIPSSQKAYFARLRADELRAGKLQSAYGPPLPPLVEDLRSKEGGDGR